MIVTIFKNSISSRHSYGGCLRGGVFQSTVKSRWPSLLNIVGKTNYAVQWILIYSMDGVTHSLNNLAVFARSCVQWINVKWISLYISSMLIHKCLKFSVYHHHSWSVSVTFPFRSVFSGNRVFASERQVHHIQEIKIGFAYITPDSVNCSNCI